MKLGIVIGHVARQDALALARGIADIDFENYADGNVA
jgi:hypothetical protein